MDLYGESSVPNETKGGRVHSLGRVVKMLVLLVTDLKLSNVNYKRAHIQNMANPLISQSENFEWK